MSRAKPGGLVSLHDDPLVHVIEERRGHSTWVHCQDLSTSFDEAPALAPPTCLCMRLACRR